MMKKLVFLLLLLACLCGCCLAEEGLSLSVTQVTMGVQEKLTLQVTCPEGQQRNVRWSSSAPNIASCKGGTLSAYRPGTAEITASLTMGKTKYTATCRVTVLTPVSTIQLSWYNGTMRVGQTRALPTLTMKPSTASVTAVTWTVSDPDTVQLTERGLVALKPGTVTLTVVSDQPLASKPRASATITVVQAVSEIRMESSLTLAPKQQATLTPEVLPADANNRSVQFLSANEDVATVNQEGRVTAQAIGQTDIYCDALDGSGVRAVCHVSVVNIAQELTVNMADPVVITQGLHRRLLASVSPSLAMREVLWVSADEAVVRVEDNTLYALAPGQAQLTVSTIDGSNLTASLTVIVEPDMPLQLTDVSVTDEGILLRGQNMTATRSITGFRFLLSREGQEDLMCEWQASAAVKPGEALPELPGRWCKADEANAFGITIVSVQYEDHTMYTIPPQCRVTIAYP